MLLKKGTKVTSENHRGVEQLKGSRLGGLPEGKKNRTRSSRGTGGAGGTADLGPQEVTQRGTTMVEEGGTELPPPIGGEKVEKGLFPQTELSRQFKQTLQP